MESRIYYFDVSASHDSLTSIATTILFQNLASSSSSEPPVTQWMSLIALARPDRADSKPFLYQQGLYDPGSGEICAKHIDVSDSDVYRHVYYNYPSVKDPGIVEALLKPELMKKYPGDGQELYLDLCRDMDIAPVGIFYRGLANKEINLKYYGVNSAGIRPMCLALVNNKYVRRLDLTGNRLDQDACYHLGCLLGESFALQELLLAGCKIGTEGLLRLVDRMHLEPLDLLDLSNNDLGDDGIPYLTYKITRGTIIRRLNLSRNDLTGKSALLLADAFEHNDKVTHLDLSWNKIFMPRGTNALFRVLSESSVLVELNFSWNGVNTSAMLANIVCVPTLQVLDLSHNRLSTDTIELIAANLHRGKKLHTLDLSHNLMTSSDALMMLKKMKNAKVKLRKLYMAETPVTKQFKSLLKDVLSLRYRQGKTTIMYGRVLRDYSISNPDLREIVLKRLDYLTRTSKKCRLDIGVFFLESRDKKQFMEMREMKDAMKLASAPVGEDLVDELFSSFSGPQRKALSGERIINLDGVVDYVRRLWPDKKIPIPSEAPTMKPVKPVTVTKLDKKKKKKK